LREKAKKKTGGGDKVRRGALAGRSSRLRVEGALYILKSETRQIVENFGSEGVVRALTDNTCKRKKKLYINNIFAKYTWRRPKQLRKSAASVSRQRQRRWVSCWR